MSDQQNELPFDDETEFKLVTEEIAELAEELNKPLSADDKINELREMLRAAEKERQAEQSKRYDVRAKMNKRIQDRESLEMKIKVKKQREETARQMAEKYEAIDKFTAAATWRTGIERTSDDGAVETLKIMKHQLDGAHFLAAAGRAICADGMGLGKTIESIATLDMVGAKRVVIVCPGDVMSGFYRELKMWSPGRAIAIIGRKPKAEQFQLIKTLREINADNFCLIVNYESWARNKRLLAELNSLQPDTVIIDEAHNIKGMNTSAYKGVEEMVFAKNICGYDECGGFILQSICTKCSRTPEYYNQAVESVKNVFLLTGTPILNRPSDIYSSLHLIDPKTFWNQNAFLRTFCTQIDNGNWIFRPGGMSQLAAQLQGIYIRRTLADTDVVLPPQDIQVHEFDLDPEDYPLQTEIIDMLKKNAQVIMKNAEDAGKAIDMTSILALITRERQAAVWPGGIVIKEPILDMYGFPVYDPETDKPLMRELRVGDDYRESIKLDKAVEMIQEMIEDGHRIVVFSQFKTALAELQERLVSCGVRSVEYHGGTSAITAEQVKTNFDRSYNEAPKWDVVLAHYKKGGVGLNFTAATQMIILDGEWNGGKEDQAYGRINRIGQTESTTVHVLRISNSIDKWLATLVERKRAMNAEFDQENSTYAELRELLMK